MKRGWLKRKSGLARGGLLKRSTQLRQTKPLARAPLRSTPPKRDEQGAAKAFFDTVCRAPSGKLIPCAICGAKRRLDAHHILPKQFLKRVERAINMPTGELVWATSNGMSLCRDCHDRHENAYRRVPRYVLPARAWEFAHYVDGLLGTAEASERLIRTYPVM